MHQSLAVEIQNRLHQILGSPDSFVSLHEPEFHGAEIENLTDCITSGWVSSVGSYVDEFEARIAHACGTKFGVAVVNGTAALQVCMQLVGVRPGDEVLIPSFTFVATANACMHSGAIPHLVDIERNSLGLDPVALSDHLKRVAENRSEGLFNRYTGRRIGALVPMHAFGHPVDMPSLLKVANEFDIPIVEDAAESLGSFLNGKQCGSFGKIAALSFNGNKIITTGGGGAIVTNDEELAKAAKHLTTTAKKPHQWQFSHDQVAFNFRMPNLNAALGVAQLAQLANRLEAKRKLAQAYMKGLNDISGVEVMVEPAGCRSNYWLNTLVLDDTSGQTRDLVLKALNNSGLMARPVWEPMHSLPMYRNCPKSNLSITEEMANRVVNIPSSAHLAKRIC